MRNAFRSLLVQSLSRIPSNSSRIQSPNLHLVLRRSLLPCSHGSFLPSNPRVRSFSSDPALDWDGRDQALVEIFSKPIGSGEIEAELEATKLSLDHEALNSVLRSVYDRPEIARKVFDWVLEKQNRVLSSKSYNLMLGILGSDGDSERFWGSVEIMKKKGYGISKGAYLKALDGFNKKGMEKDSDLLKTMYFLNSHENVVVRACPRVCKILREFNETEEVFKNLDDLEISLPSDLVVAVLDRICSDQKKALTFFRWAEGKPSFRVDGSVYNALARVCGREDCMEEFRIILQRMRNEGYGMEKETYVKVSHRFYNRKMIVEAVELFEFAMHGSEKPQHSDLLLLLRKIAVSKDLDMDLVSKAVRVYKNAGQSVKGSVFSGVLKSLASVGKLGGCSEVLKAMEVGGFVPDVTIHNQVVIGLCNAGELDKALEYLDGMEKSGHTADTKSWVSLIQKHCKAGELDKGLSCLHKMVDIRGGENVGSPIEVLVNSYCHNNKFDTALKTLKEMVVKKQVQPWHCTYKFLIEKLISQGKLREASSLLGLMKTHGFPPYIDPFIGYFSKSGTVDDAMVFLKAMTVQEFPSKTVFLRMFETLLKAGRHEVAYDLLSKSPGSVRNHADVLDLFYSMKPEEADLAVAL
ncbi:hypothetical protein J5N97_006557 [Dioscorea zingiberensis]|uniref:Pentatricopeptide repeat-containing protein n=1 Tax=Dioscorea zingiberensis TaxID=325984 RepID=A0A9D5HTQ2_9LILI|nr:hypothetical protein J5N97_006557 [Dioscorea zingiberensis]